jgi:hypothetical protein
LGEHKVRPYVLLPFDGELVLIHSPRKTGGRFSKKAF